MKRPQLLLIDDDRKLVRLLTGFLELQGFDTSAVHDGAEGLRLLRAQDWDLVILDLMLPGIDGHQVLAQLRRHSQVPVLMLTGRGAEDDLIAGLEGGADDYLPKTASSRELATRIRALLRRAARPAAQDTIGERVQLAPLRVGSLCLYPSSRSVTVEDKPVVLTAVEFDLLLSLARREGVVCTRELLLKEVRRRDFDVFDRAIDVHIASLRRKLGDDARTARFIRTVRAIGYSLVSASIEADRVRISIQDRGPGVPESALARLGEPFFRPDLARTRASGGFGLGLAIVRRCILSCDGDVIFRNRTGGGFEAVLTVPLATGDRSVNTL